LPAKFSGKTPEPRLPRVAGVRIRRGLKVDELADAVEQLGRELALFSAGTTQSMARLVDTVQSCQEAINGLVDNLTP